MDCSLVQKCKYLCRLIKDLQTKAELQTKAQILYFPPTYQILTYLWSVFGLNEAVLQKQSLETRI